MLCFVHSCTFISCLFVCKDVLYEFHSTFLHISKGHTLTNYFNPHPFRLLCSRENVLRIPSSQRTVSTLDNCTEPDFSYESPELPLRMVAIFALPIKPDFHNTKILGKIIHTTIFSKYTLCLNNSFFSSEMTVPWQQQMLSWVRVREVPQACISLPTGAPGSLLASLSFQV